MIWSLLAVVVAVSGAVSPPAPPPAVQTLTAARAPGPIDVDGRLTDPAWTAATSSTAFTQQYPNEGAAPTESTEVRIVYDDRAVYIGINCVQRLTPIVARLTRRDRVTSADRVTVDISSRADWVTAFHFGVSAAGVLDDGIYFNDSNYSSDWDENWEAATWVGPDGWSAEIKIPFRILRFDAGLTQRWGLQVQRYTDLRHEWDLWAWRPRSSAGVVSTFGVVDGWEGISPSRPVELRVSELTKLQFRDVEARGDLSKAHDWIWSVGLDAKAHPTQGTTLDLTVNPDFGQVEADQVVLNLSNYEVFYPEKRPFFLEGLDTLSTTRSVLYTRRIGARPPDPIIDTAVVNATSNETLVDSIGPSRIWAAGKLVGAVTPRTSVALLSALTGENTAEVRLADGGTVKRSADPLSIYNVLRARHRWGTGLDGGFLVTSTNRFEHVRDYPATRFQCPSRAGDPASSAAARCTSDAYVAALDARWRSPSAVYVVGGQLVTSMLARGPSRLQPDGIAVRPGQPSFGGTINAVKQGGAHWLATMVTALSGRQLDYNDLGYLERKNDSFTYADLTYRTLNPWWHTTDTGSTVAVSHRQTLDGIRLEDHIRLSTFATFRNFWSASFAAYYHAPHFDDRETGDGTALERAGLGGAEIWMGSDSRRLLTGALWAQAQRLVDGVQLQASASLGLRPSSRVDLELSPSVLYADGEPRFIEKGPANGFYYFGKLRASNVGVTARATVGLRPTLTFQFYGQLFLATKRFLAPSQFRVAAGAFRTEVHISQLQPIASWTVPDTQQAVLNLNAVLRWEYRLGSTIYLVYTRAQSPALTLMSGQVPRLDPRALTGNRGSTDALMLKASFWWG
jgi:Domain of unknown function (DUF5916)